MADVEDFIDGGDGPDIFDPEVVAAIEDAAKERVSATDQAIQAHLRRSKQAYCAVFVSGTATAADIEFVMQDLFWFAKGDTHFFNDARLQDVMAGRKQVLQRIVEYTRFDFTTLHEMYVKAQK